MYDSGWHNPLSDGSTFLALSGILQLIKRYRIALFVQIDTIQNRSEHFVHIPMNLRLRRSIYEIIEKNPKELDSSKQSA